MQFNGDLYEAGFLYSKTTSGYQKYNHEQKAKLPLKAVLIVDISPGEDSEMIAEWLKTFRTKLLPV